MWYAVGTMEKGPTMLQRINNVKGRILIAGDENCWDSGFLESLEQQINKGSDLTSRQEQVLQQIEGRWSDEALKARAVWAETWDEEKEAKFSIALHYYRKTNYYMNIVYKYLDSDGNRQNGAPSEKEYNKLVLNKYACAVIQNIQSEPKFPVGATAVFRSSVRGKLWREGNAGNVCVILQHGGASEVRTHAKGGKPVQVLPVGSAIPIWTEERWLKKAKKRK